MGVRATEGKASGSTTRGDYAGTMLLVVWTRMVSQVLLKALSKVLSKVLSQVLSKVLSQALSRAVSLLLPLALLAASPSLWSAKIVEVASFEEFAEKANFDSVEDPSLRHFQIKMNDAAFKKLLDRRNEALEDNILETRPDDYVKAKLRQNGRESKIKMRLKGDYVEHLSGLKWSFRIKVRGDDAVMGMKVFSLQHPKMRLYTHEYVVHQALKNENLIHLRYDYVKVSINGVYLGLFNLEEHFEKRLIENNARREGPILKFDETKLFEYIKADIYEGGKHDTPTFMSAEILPFNGGKLEDNYQQMEYFRQGRDLLNKFRRGQARVGDVFKIEEFARYYAITDVFMGKHGIRWHNQRFYYDPIEARLGPVGFDFNDDKPGLDPPSRINRGNGLFYGTNWAFDVFSRMIFSDPEFFAAFVREGLRISERSYVEKLLRKIAPEAERMAHILHHEFSNNESKYFDYHEEFFQHYYDAADYVQRALRANGGLNVHVKSRVGNELALVLNNRSQHLLDIKGIEVAGAYTPFENIQALHSYRFYNPYIPSNHNLREMRLSVDESVNLDNISIIFSTLGLNERWKASPFMDHRAPGAPTPYEFPKPIDASHPMHMPANWQEFSFLSMEGGVIRAREGEWYIDKHLVLPKAVPVEFPPGFQLDIKKKANLIIKGPVNFNGDKGSPIKIHSSDNSGGGVFVFKAKLPSTVSYTRFENLSNPRYKRWALTGAVTFYESPVTIEHSAFLHNRSEDGLNTIRSHVMISHSEFGHTQSDAFDGDFCSGQIKASLFYLTGNDAVDVSGSDFLVSDVTINSAGDKGVSVGERSKVQLIRVEINKAKTGFASKDSSTLNILDSKASNTTLGVVAYQKKPEYGPGQIVAKNLQLPYAEIPMLFEEGSVIQLDDKPHQAEIGKKQKLIFDALRNGQDLN